MGFEGLISFLIRNLSNDSFDEINLNINYNKLVSKYILIDFSFILYNCYIEIEEDINLVLKYIYSFSCTEYDVVVNLIKNHFKKDHWKDLNISLDGENQNDISEKFKNFLTENNNKNLFLVLSKYIVNKLKTILDNLFETNFTKEIIFFFDSIPSYSKILEQRNRRLKNYLESKNRKSIYTKYFSNLIDSSITEDNLEYEYFSWMKSKFNANKIIDTNSLFIIELKEYLLKNLKINNKIKIIIDSENLGEADYKIFKYISSNNLKGKLTILSCDSDLVYQILLQQHNYVYLSKEIDLYLYKFYINSFDYCQLYNSNKILNHLNTIYNETNNIKNNNNFCLDFLFLLNFFGNDQIPSSLEFGPELNFNCFLKLYYDTLGKNNLNIISSEKKNILDYNINFLNLCKILKEINKLSLFSKIIMLRYFKVPYLITSILTEKLEYKLNEIPEKLLKPYLIFKGKELKDKLEDNDIRLILYNNYVKENPINEIKNPINIEENPLYCTQLNNLLDNYLDYTDLEFYGFKNNIWSCDFNDKNKYKNLYEYISKISAINNDNKYLSFDYKIESSNNEKIQNYLFMLYFIVKTTFNEMKFYSSTNLTKYPFDEIPSLIDIITFLEIVDLDNLEDYFMTLFIKNSIKTNEFFDSIFHHLIITPYLYNSNYINLLDNKDILNLLIENFDNNLKKIWCDDINDNFNKVNPKELLNSWKKLLYTINLKNRIEFKNNLLINFNVS